MKKILCLLSLLFLICIPLCSCRNRTHTHNVSNAEHIDWLTDGIIELSCSADENEKWYTFENEISNEYIFRLMFDKSTKVPVDFIVYFEREMGQQEFNEKDIACQKSLRKEDISSNIFHVFSGCRMAKGKYYILLSKMNKNDSNGDEISLVVSIQSHRDIVENGADKTLIHHNTMETAYDLEHTYGYSYFGFEANDTDLWMRLGTYPVGDKTFSIVCSYFDNDVFPKLSFFGSDGEELDFSATVSDEFKNACSISYISNIKVDSNYKGDIYLRVRRDQPNDTGEVIDFWTNIELIRRD